MYMKKSVFPFLALSVVPFGSCLHEPVDKTGKPNIVFILADDMSYRDLSCYGQQQFSTPNLDKLAREGVRFTQAYSGAPACAPSRGCLLTGLDTGHGRIRANSGARGQDHLLTSDITIAELLREAGYICGFTGKWGIGQQGTEGVPHLKGFDYSFGFYDQVEAHTYFPEYLFENGIKIEYPGNKGFDIQLRYDMKPYFPPEDLNRYDANGKLLLPELADRSQAVYSVGVIEQATVDFVRKNHTSPFFLYHAPQLPHGPVIIDDLGVMNGVDEGPLMAREWAAMNMRLDRFVGELVDLLKELGVYDNTILFFASDNGYSFCGEMGRGNAPHWHDDPWLRNKGPFTGGKFSVLEGGIRVPFFVSWPARYNPAVLSQPVWLPDFFPTALELAGLPLKHHVQGKSLIPLLEGRVGDFIGHEYMYFSANREQALRMGPWKAYRETPDHPVQLYLIEEDTYTRSDLSSSYPIIAEKARLIMDTAWVPSDWYWDPGETREEYLKKVQRAVETEQVLPVYRPNGLKKLPWEQ